jgi:hypothetical protein
VIRRSELRREVTGWFMLREKKEIATPRDPTGQ